MVTYNAVVAIIPMNLAAIIKELQALLNMLSITINIMLNSANVYSKI